MGNLNTQFSLFLHANVKNLQRKVGEYQSSKLLKAAAQ